MSKPQKRRSPGQRRAPVSIPGYRIDALLGKGGMGTVYRAHQVVLDRPVAIKILDDRWAKDTSFVQQFLREARSAAKIDHPNVVRAIDAGSADGVFYFVMEYVRGDTVDDMLRRMGRLSQEVALDIVDQMADALIHAEKVHIIHRDIKPGNILLMTNGVAKLSDLGLAREITDLSQEESDTVIGTPHYMSPEQIKGRDDLDVRSDIYSLGVTLYAMLTGECPFTDKRAAAVIQKHLFAPRPNASAGRPDVSPHVAALVRRMMAIDRDMRPASAKKLKALIAKTKASVAFDASVALGALADVPADETGTADADESTAKPKAIMIGGAAGALAAASCLVLVLTLRGRSEPEPEPPAPTPAVVEIDLEQENARLEAERRETAAKIAFEKVSAHHKKHPEDCIGVLAGLEKVAADHTGTDAGARAADEAAALRASIDARVEEMSGDAAKAVAAGDFKKAERLHIELLSAIPGDPWKTNMEEAAAGIREEARASFDKIVEKTDALVAAGEFDEARTMMQNGLGRTVEAIAKDEAGRIAVIDAALQKVRMEQERLAALLTRGREKALGQLAEEGIRAMMRSYEVLVVDPKFRDVRASLKHDFTELKRVKTVLEKAGENGPSFVGKQFTIRGVTGKILRVANGRVTISVQDIQTSEAFERLEADDILNLAGISLADRKKSQDAAVVYLCRGEHGKAREILEQLSKMGNDVKNVISLLDVAEQSTSKRATGRTTRKPVRLPRYLAAKGR